MVLRIVLPRPFTLVRRIMPENKDSNLTQLRDTLIDRGESSPVPEFKSAPRFGSLPPPAPLDPKDPLLMRVSPLLELLYLMHATVGVVGQGEEAVLRGVARTLNSDLEDHQLTSLFERYAERLRRAGLDERIYSVTEALSLDKVTAESAYTLAATLAWANDDVSSEEEELLGDIAEKLGISGRRASELRGLKKP